MTAIKLLAETEDTVTLRRSDFQELIEAAEIAEDLAAVQAHRVYEDNVGWDAARRNYLTVDETRRLLEGENPLRVWREKRGLIQRGLAEAAQIGTSYLAEIESGKKPGSAEALQRAAAVLEVAIEDLAGTSGRTAHVGIQPVTRSHQAAARLVKLAEAHVTPERIASEVHAIISRWLEIADKEGARHQVKAAVGALRFLVTETSTIRARLAQEQDRIGDTGAAKRLRRVSTLLEAAIDALREAYRRL